MSSCKVSLILFFVFVFYSLQADGSGKIGEKVIVKTRRAGNSPVIDGRLDENICVGAPISGFTQKDPLEGEPASERTDVWITYDESAFYIAAKLYDSHPDSIIGHLARRDYWNESDWFTVFIDPYYDRRTGYYFSVNAAGAVMDGTLFNDDWDESSWNGVWDYAVSRDSTGWNVEMKIPFTQIRFKESDSMKWGVNFKREIQRKQERNYLVMIPKKESGFVSHFATLEGLDGVHSQQRLELLPYFVSKASFLVHDPNDPFYLANQFEQSVGGDLKLGFGSNLTLDATFNPDFGQVEVDPAVVNLSAFETYYDEKRPFFIEGNNIFYFGSGGTNNNWSFNWGNPEIFYSRRIGRNPRGPVDAEGYVDRPDETTIIGAAKVTGKISNEWSLGFINATTARTYATIYDEGAVSKEQIEPLTNYSVARVQKEFQEGRHGLGFMGTSVIRDKNSGMNDIVADNSFEYGTDGWVTLDNEDTYVLKGYLSGSYVTGTQDYLVLLQESPLRYLQRPDAVNYRLDSSATSLSGYIARFDLNKQKGNFYLNTAFGMASPGYEVNDIGFQSRADVINTHLVLGYRWFEPEGIFRSKSVYAAAWRGYNYDGDRTDQGYMAFSNFQFMNYYGFGVTGGYNPENLTNRLTRGGPMAMYPSGWFINTNVYTDNREPIILDAYAEYNYDELRTKSMYFSFGFSWKPNSQINLRIGPSYNKRNDALEWVGSFQDPYAVNTYGGRYVFAEIFQETVSGNIRLDWTFTPRLTLQLYMQPLFAAGDYLNYKELARPRTFETNTYGENGSEITIDRSTNTYTVDPDGTGPAQSFSFDNPDFNFKSLRGNIVLRWEFLPGSVFFLVWTHEKANFDNPGKVALSRDFSNLWDTSSDNIFMAKVTYWINM